MRRAGLWLANGTPSDPSLMYAWRPGTVVSFYDYLNANRVAEYKAKEPGAQVVIRFQHPTNWHQDVATSARLVATGIISKWPELRDLSPWFYFANELNLHYENGDADPGRQAQYETPEWYAKVGEWYRIVADAIHQAIPELEMVCPPFAFGHHEDGAPDDDGKPKDGWAGYDHLVEVIKTHFKNRIAGHYYWGDGAGSKNAWLYGPDASWYAFRWRRVLRLFKTRYNIDAQVLIDEAGNFGAADADFTDQCAYYLTECLADNRVIGLAFFLWEDPTRSPGNLPNSWVQRCQDLPRHVTRMAALAEPSPVLDDATIRVRLASGVVKTLSLEEYLRAVVPAEVYASWPMEALKAQAVAARTYARVRMVQSRAAGVKYDITAGTGDQVYNEARIHERSDAAVAETAGQVLRYGGKLAAAYYSANCAGETLGNETGFGGKPLPWLRPVPCINKGAQNGHRVGMCQWGAHDMAAAGADYLTILRHYYTGITIDGAEPSEGETDMSIWLPIDDRIPANLRAHAQANGIVTGSVMRIMDAETAGLLRGPGQNLKLAKGDRYFRVKSLWFADENAAQGGYTVFVQVLTTTGAPYSGAQVWHAYPSGKAGNQNWLGQWDNGSGNGDTFLYPSGSGELAMGANDFKPAVGSDELGPYLYAAYGLPSEVVGGAGMPFNRHVRYGIVFEEAFWGGVVTPEPTPTPTPGGNGCMVAFLDALVTALKK